MKVVTSQILVLVPKAWTKIWNGYPEKNSLSFLALVPTSRGAYTAQILIKSCICGSRESLTPTKCIHEQITTIDTL